MSKVTRPNGFTIIELIISITVFVFLTTVVVFGFRGAGQANNLRQNAAELVANLRRAQSLAQTGAVVNVCSDWAAGIRSCTTDANCAPASCGVVPQDGFGIQINNADPTKYKLFASLNTNHSSAFYYTIEGGDVTMVDQGHFGAYQNDIIIFQRPRGTVFSGAPDPYFCVVNDNLNIVRKVTVKTITGQIEESAVAVCS